MVTLAAFIWARWPRGRAHHRRPDPGHGRLVGPREHVGRRLHDHRRRIVVIAYVIGWLLLTRTRMGRYTYAMGGDPTPRGGRASMSRRYTLLVFLLMGLMIGLGSIIVVGQLASAQPYVAAGLGLDAIIAVIIGGTRLMGGEGSIGRTAARASRSSRSSTTACSTSG